MSFRLRFTPEAQANLNALDAASALRKRRQAVRKTLGLMETNLRHPGLQTHVFHSLTGANGEKVFEAYAESRTPGAYRIFWHYGPGKGELTILAITPHP